MVGGGGTSLEQPALLNDDGIVHLGAGFLKVRTMSDVLKILGSISICNSFEGGHIATRLNPAGYQHGTTQGYRGLPTYTASRAPALHVIAKTILHTFAAALCDRNAGSERLNADHER